jgi:gliding motility-associated-like protein
MELPSAGSANSISPQRSLILLLTLTSRFLKAMKAIILIITISLTSLISQGQKMYVSLGNGTGIRKVNVTPTGCISDTFVVCPNENYFALALYGNQLYYATNAILNVGTIVNNTLTNCHPVDITPSAMSSMTVDVNGVIYAASSNVLFRWDPASGLGFESLGSMPFISAGDMAFFEGELYMASKTGIVKVNIANPSLSTMHIPMNSVSVYGMAILSVDCNLNKVYAFETVNAGDATNVIELDIPNRSVVGVVCTVPFGVADAASEVEGGTFAGISIQEIKVLPQCKVPGKGTIRVIREPGQAPYTYVLDGNITNSTGVFEFLDPGNYHIEITTPGGCYKDTMVAVPLFLDPVPTVTEHHISPDCVAGGKVWFTIQPDNGSNKVIYNNDTVSASHTFLELDEGIHHFSIVDQYYCELDSKDIRLQLEGSCDTVYFPSAFTPNNNGRNDLFRGLGNRSVKDYDLAVFNRYGQVVFHSKNVLSGWNGNISDFAQPSGVYVWIASYTTRSGIHKSSKGTVLLIR